VPWQRCVVSLSLNMCVSQTWCSAPHQINNGGFSFHVLFP
jgi:hypothetical protein